MMKFVHKAKWLCFHKNIYADLENNTSNYLYKMINSKKIREDFK